MIVSARLIRRTVAALDTRITSCQYSGWRTNSFAYRYSTESGTPTARNASLKYSAHTRRFSRLPPSLSLMYACQSARKMIVWNPAWTRSVIFDPITKAVPTCMRPEGSRPTYAFGAARSRRTRNSSRVTTSSVPRTNVSSRSSGGIAPRNLQFRDKAFNRLVRRSGQRSGGLREASHGLKKGPTIHGRGSGMGGIGSIPLVAGPVFALQGADVIGFFVVFFFLVIIVLIFVFATIKVVKEYERIVNFRLGKAQAEKGPGIVIIIPGIDKPVRVD